MSTASPRYSLWEGISAALTLAMRAIEEARAIPAGRDGKDGFDGVGFDDLDLVHDERGVFLRFVKGENVKEFRLPIVVDRGVFKAGQTYNKGDGTTWGGSFWIAQEETTEKPDSGKGWRCAVKRGRDGRDGKDGERGPEGQKGDPGKDLTQILPDGTRY